jgi:choline kinase
VIEYIDKDIILTISDVVYEQDQSIINNKSGLIVDQMKTIIEQIY